ncbi:MAG: hypothetical protein ABIW76_12850, partial [Fibrobacteria bacterium]
AKHNFGCIRENLETEAMQAMLAMNPVSPLFARQPVESVEATTSAQPRNRHIISPTEGLLAA